MRSTIALVLMSLVALSASEFRKQAFAERAAIESALRFQPAMPGVALPLPMLTELTEPRLYVSRPLQAANQHLIYVVSDTCPYCHDEMTQWRNLLSVASASQDTAVWIIPKSGDVLARRLLASAETAGLRASIATPRPHFVVATGLRGTPHTALLNQAMEIRLTTGRLTPGAFEIFRDQLLSTLETKTTTSISKPYRTDAAEQHN